jgi:hypothetical protein
MDQKKSSAILPEMKKTLVMQVEQVAAVVAAGRGV